MKHPILFVVLMAAAAPVVAQDDVDFGGRAVSVSRDITLTGGDDLYRSVCRGCHQPDGSGAEGAGAYPALKGSPNLAFPDYAISVVVNGQRAMPPFGELLDDRQVAAVVQFIQTSWGNEAEILASPDLVENIRH